MQKHFQRYLREYSIPANVQRKALSPSRIMLENGLTYFKELAVGTLQDL